MTGDRGRIPPPLRLCRGCRQFVRMAPETCHFCGVDLDAADASYRSRLAAVKWAARRLRRLVDQAKAG